MEPAHLDGEHALAGTTRSPDGVPIAWFRDGSGPPLVLVHGTTADHTTWRASGPLLARSFTTYAVDRRGRGGSGDSTAYSIEREYDDLAAVAEDVSARHGRPVGVVGHSYGGRIGLGAALRTDAIRRLVVYEGAPAPPNASYQLPDLVDRLERSLAAGDRAEMLREFMREIVGLSEADLSAFETAPVWPFRVAAAPTIVRELRSESSPAARLDVLSSVSIPVLQILGGASRPVFADATYALDERLPDGRVVVLADQRHNAHHAAADEFVATIRRFLGEPGR